ncbi:tRNA (adenosine(37)-N6)-threonylcarbamoyltransferase complex dimerization subunit type 1 TsaB [Vagococcus acidifermentans]|uniref:tRNA (Adenosine(37)-N6)-threonylcarbamoyltransferase complex dimerization subunit type 1 TsaB n=1 Tax=Vagococcus acidifermentans TaxID=564710 RepID=A0A430AXU6_9ENTE|nr:tRNA (adenosine(37)-N6)-threonylcarbamoyltransferase complex dimerization subunit type 1 TsaB [Vagococcus acidifermentans]RSU12856.1 tRNA (adenosine(37)-N6)-threonylcarbamoyltransferase complex dimerization subunit type 1 TsaB [Vagococcus acidifermentans]
MKVLTIDTSNQLMAVGIGIDRQLIGSYVSSSKNHSVTLMPAIDFLMKEAGWQPQEIERIIVAKGPGSYTGLRIGVTTAKTLAWTLDAELLAVSSLAVLAANTDSAAEDVLIVPLMDARRKNIYTGAYQWQQGQLVNVLPDRHVSLAEWLQLLKKQPVDSVRFIGRDAPQFAGDILLDFPADSLPNQTVLHQVQPVSMLELADDAEVVANIGGFTPEYLKRVEAEEKWLEGHHEELTSYVERT